MMKEMDAASVLAEMDGNIAYQIQGSTSFETLALCSKELDCATCTFLDDARYIGLIVENIKVIFTTPILAEKLQESKYGLMLTDQPRILFFTFYNMLAGNSCYIRIGYGTEI